MNYIIIIIIIIHNWFNIIYVIWSIENFDIVSKKAKGPK